MTVNKVVSRYKSLQDKRNTWLNHCKEVTRYVLPTRGHYSALPQDKREKEFNDKAYGYLENLASMFLAGLTSPSRQWFKLHLPDEDLSEWNSVKVWLTEVEKILFGTLQASGFYTEINNVYRDIIGFGTACISVTTDMRQGHAGLPHYATYQPGEYYVGVDEYNAVNVVYREIWLDAVAVHNRWGKSCSRELQRLAVSDPYRPVKICHAVEPRETRDISKLDKLNKAYASYWWEYGSDNFLSESGFDTMPYLVGRWNVDNCSAYGTGPGWIAVKQAKALNLLEYSATYGVNKAVNPPVLVPSRMYDINTNPGGINYYDGNPGDKQIYPLQPAASDLSPALTFINRWESTLKEIFKNDLFIFLMENRNATATEIATRNDEKLLLLSPALERIQTELLTPLLDGTLGMLMDNGMLPEPPQELIGKSIRPQFIGVLAQAQRHYSLQGINQVAGLVGNLTQIDENVRDKFDCDQAVDAFSLIVGTPARVVRSDEEVDKIRAERKLALEEQMQAELEEVGYAVK